MTSVCATWEKVPSCRNQNWSCHNGKNKGLHKPGTGHSQGRTSRTVGRHTSNYCDYRQDQQQEKKHIFGQWFEILAENNVLEPNTLFTRLRVLMKRRLLAWRDPDTSDSDGRATIHFHYWWAALIRWHASWCRWLSPHFKSRFFPCKSCCCEPKWAARNTAFSQLLSISNTQKTSQDWFCSTCEEKSWGGKRPRGSAE